MSKKLFDYIDKVKKGDSKTMKMIAEYNPNEPQYDSAIGKFRLGDKTGALSDFIKPGDKLPRVDFKLNDTGKYINHPSKVVSPIDKKLEYNESTLSKREYKSINHERNITRVLQNNKIIK